MSCLVTKLNGVVNNPDLPKFKEMVVSTGRLAVLQNIQQTVQFTFALCENVSVANPFIITGNNCTFTNFQNMTRNTSVVPTSNIVTATEPNCKYVLSFTYNDYSLQNATLTINNRFLMTFVSNISTLTSSNNIIAPFIFNINDFIGMKNIKNIRMDGLFADKEIDMNDIGCEFDPTFTNSSYGPSIICALGHGFRIDFSTVKIKRPYNLHNFTIQDFNNNNWRNFRIEYYGVGHEYFSNVNQFPNSDLFNTAVILRYLANAKLLKDVDISKACWSFVDPINLIYFKWDSTTKAQRGLEYPFIIYKGYLDPTSLQNYIACFTDYYNYGLTGHFNFNLSTDSDFNPNTAGDPFKNNINTMLTKGNTISINGTAISHLN